jgi:hypothetical protein
MTSQQLREMWNAAGIETPTSWNADEPNRNYASYPEEIISEEEEGIRYGFHYGPEVDAFHPEYTTCAYNGEDFDMDEIKAKAQEREDKTLYMVKMYASEYFPIRHCRGEVRQIGGRCSYKKI